MTIVCATWVLRLRISLYKQLIRLLQKQQFYHLLAEEYNVAI